MYSDLAEYSIMLNGEKAVAHTSSHYPLSGYSGKSTKITLPPILDYLRLTEKTLNLFNIHSLLEHVNAAPSLTSSLLATELPLSSPSLLSSEINSLSLPEAAQRLVSLSISPAPYTTLATESEEIRRKKRRQKVGPSCDHCRTRKVKCNADVIMLSRSFDVAELDSDFKDEFTLSAKEKDQLCSGSEVRTACAAVLVVSKGRLMRFLPCSSCSAKNLSCCFSKGFTKEDVIHNKKRQSLRSHVTSDNKQSFIVSEESNSDSSRLRLVSHVANSTVSSFSTPDTSLRSDSIGSLGAAGSTRKSSCSACRQRKIKCVLSSLSIKCMACIKKDYLCSFEV